MDDVLVRFGPAAAPVGDHPDVRVVDYADIPGLTDACVGIIKEDARASYQTARVEATCALPEAATSAGVEPLCRVHRRIARLPRLKGRGSWRHAGPARHRRERLPRMAAATRCRLSMDDALIRSDRTAARLADHPDVRVVDHADTPGLTDACVGIIKEDARASDQTAHVEATCALLEVATNAGVEPLPKAHRRTARLPPLTGHGS